jgi:hypothetical protein
MNYQWDSDVCQYKSLHFNTMPGIRMNALPCPLIAWAVAQSDAREHAPMGIAGCNRRYEQHYAPSCNLQYLYAGQYASGYALPGPAVALTGFRDSVS